MATITDWGTAIISALANALALLLAFIPRIIGFLIILLVGWLIAKGVSQAITVLLRKIGFDRLGDRIGLSRLEQNMGVSLDAAGILGKIVYWFIFLIFLVPAADALGIPAVSNVLSSIVNFLPNVFVAILVLFFGALLATFVADLVRGFTASSRVGNPNVFAMIARYAIIGFAALIALEQLNIAPALLNELFGAIVAGAALAFGLAFGLGGQGAAQRLLNRTESTVSTVASQAQQSASSPQGGSYYPQQNPAYNQPLQSTDQTRTFPSKDATRPQGIQNRPLTDR
jgi:Conserved TM helix